MRGDYYSIARGIEVNTLINEDSILTEVLDANCVDIRKKPNTTDALGRYDAYILYLDR